MALPFGSVQNLLVQKTVNNYSLNSSCCVIARRLGAGIYTKNMSCNIADIQDNLKSFHCVFSQIQVKRIGKYLHDYDDSHKKCVR